MYVSKCMQVYKMKEKLHERKNFQSERNLKIKSYILILITQAHK